MKKWSDPGLTARVDQANSMGHVSELLAVTGGWDLLLEEVFAAAKGNDLKPGADRVRAALDDVQSAIRRRFLLATGLEGDPHGELLGAILKYTDGELTPDLLPDLIEVLRDDVPGLTEVTMQRALEWYEHLGVTQHRDGKLRVDAVTMRALRVAQ